MYLFIIKIIINNNKYYFKKTFINFNKKALNLTV